MSEIFDCPSCRAILDYTPSDTATIKCDYCGQTIVVPEQLRKKPERVPAGTFPLPSPPSPPPSPTHPTPPPSDTNKAIWLGRIGLLLIGLSWFWPEMTWNPTQTAFIGILLRLFMFFRQKRWGWFMCWLLLLPLCLPSVSNNFINPNLFLTPQPTTTFQELPQLTPPSSQPLTPSPATTIIPTASDHSAHTIQGCVVNVSSLNVRSGPGTNYEAVSFLYEGDCLEVDAQSLDGEWVRISNPTELQGQWVFLQFIETFNNTTNLPIAPTP